ncbi:isoleucine--tRNA ligase [Anaplasmataceae bacterium AB001_6]|nr:isoleucine--tRNA ligase [Anaplasmataceae bacterium AB001_6]
MKKFQDTNPNVDLSAVDKEILNYWQNNDTFRKSVERNNESEFIFYDGPPFANGLPHYGHLLTGFIKDAIARFQTMQGKKVNRRFGWDCHGLPAEMGAEKELNISGRKAIENFGIEKFNEHCRSSVMQYTNNWKEYVIRQARWVDFDNSYKTMDLNFMESVIWAFKELYKKGLIYESKKVVPYSWKCQTPLANFETKMDNCYRAKTSKAITVALKLKNIPKSLINVCSECYLLAWTTTPWTLPSNLMLAIGKDIKYAAKIEDNKAFISSANYIKDDTKIVEIDYQELINLEYEPLFTYFKDNTNSFRVTEADFVTESDGTGIVHIAPGFGEDDFELCKKKNVNAVCPIDEGGIFTKEVSDFKGRQVFECEEDIIAYLKQRGNLIKIESYVHNYPHCWRTDTPLIYRTISSWYLKVENIKDQMVQLNQEINWIPGHIKDGMFGKWLENARDWAISRNRFWGTPIPIWKSDNDKYPRIDVYGSIAELEKDFNIKVDDLHKHVIDKLTRPNPDDPSGESKMVRIPEVFDCWFESGSMPYAQNHYPFENKEWFEKNFPADFITEYISQTRGWFYTLLVLSVALFNKIPFKNCICHGVVLDAQGQKLSKRLNNYPDPIEMFNKYGSDPLRFLMLSSPVSNSGNLLIDKDGKMIQDVSRLIIKPLWNAYHFFSMYANSDEITNVQVIDNSMNEMDNYILCKAKIFIKKVNQNLNDYHTVDACHAIDIFLDVLNNWYIRRNRSRFWKKEHDQDKKDAYNTLYTVITVLCKTIAPLLPVVSEKIWLGLGNRDSVHLERSVENIDLTEEQCSTIAKIDLVKDICQFGLSLRNKHKIRIRHPLQRMSIFYEDHEDITKYKDIIEQELNVKSVDFAEDYSSIATRVIKLNFPVLGKKFPEKVKVLQKELKAGNYEIVDDHLKIANTLLSADTFEKKIKVNHENAISIDKTNIVLYLDTEITPQLELEGKARDFIRFIQQARKEANLEITQKITIQINNADQKLLQSIKNWEQEILEQTLAGNIEINNLKPSGRIVFASKMENSDINLLINCLF